MSVRRILVAAAATVLLAGGCTGGDETTPTRAPTSARASSPSSTPSPSTPSPSVAPGGTGPTSTPLPGPVTPSGIEEIVTGLDAPWSIAFLSSTEALVSQRDEGTIVHVTDAGEVTEVGAVPGVEGEGEGGLLGIAFDPASPSTLYVYATMGPQNVVVRTTYADGAFGEFETVLDGIPAGARHDGGRLAFGPDGMLYVSTGETGDEEEAQNLESLAGKILRITPDGGIPEDNPFSGSPIYSYGHRNVEGLAFDDDGQLWASEFGSDEADELNRIEPGGNYGWPIVEGIAGDDRFIDPVLEWPPSEASPSGLAYVRDTFFLAALRGQRLWQVPVVDGQVGEPTAYVQDYGRLRDVVVAPDGTLWVLTNNTDGRTEPRPGDDRILRITLAAS